MRHLLRLDTAPTAVVAVQDYLALGAMEAIRDAGLVVGSDVAVVGFDDNPSAAVASPPLSSVRQPMEQVGQLVVEMLLRSLGHDARQLPSSAMVVPELVIRASSGPEGSPS
jgi:LacI family transcriptional regulator